MNLEEAAFLKMILNHFGGIHPLRTSFIDPLFKSLGDINLPKISVKQRFLLHGIFFYEPNSDY